MMLLVEFETFLDVCDPLLCGSHAALVASGALEGRVFHLDIELDLRLCS